CGVERQLFVMLPPFFSLTDQSTGTFALNCAVCPTRLLAVVMLSFSCVENGVLLLLLPPQALKKTRTVSKNDRSILFMGDLPEVKGASLQIEWGNSSGAWESARRQFPVQASVRRERTIHLH